jgi:transposase InsO family protein
MDLHSRRIVGWVFALQADTELVILALEQARRNRRPAAGLMFHSDQGCQYISERFVNELKATGMVQSMSRKGNCWDTQSKKNPLDHYTLHFGETKKGCRKGRPEKRLWLSDETGIELQYELLF